MHDGARARRFALTASGGAVGAVIVAAAGILGHLPGLRILGSIRADYIPMAPSTAACFLILGAVLFHTASRPRQGASQQGKVALAMLVVVFGVLAVAGHFAGLEFTLESRFTQGLGTLGDIPIGRMSPMTGAGFVIAGLGTALLLLRSGASRHARGLGHWAASLGVMTALMATTVLLAYLYGAPFLYGGATVPVAATTAAAFLSLGIALAAAAGPASFPASLFVGDSTAAVLARAFVPLTVAAVILDDVLAEFMGSWAPGNDALSTAVGAVAVGILALWAVTHVSHLIGGDLDEAARTLRESETRNRAVSQTANDAIITADRTGHVVSWNHAAESMFGYTESEIVGQSITMLMPTEFKALHSAGMQRFTSGGEPHVIGKTVELLGTHKNGIVFPLELSLASWTSSGDQFFTGIIRNITERKKAAEEQLALQRQLANMQKMESVGLLAGGVAHEFNNALAAILGYAELSMRKLGSGHAVSPYVEAILTSARHSADLAGRLLAFARTQSMLLKTLDLNETVSGVRAKLPALLGDHAQVEWTPGSALWSIEADAAQIERVVTSLAENARDAMEGQDGSLSLSTANVVLDEKFALSHLGSRTGEFVHLRCRDNGSGMDAQTLSHLFEPFFTTKPPGKGTGLGLATVYGVVDQHHGFIIVESAPGAGTTIHLYFPRSLAPAA